MEAHTPIIFPSMTAVRSCIAHGGDIVKAKRNLTLYIHSGHARESQFLILGVSHFFKFKTTFAH